VRRRWSCLWFLGPSLNFYRFLFTLYLVTVQQVEEYLSRGRTYREGGLIAREEWLTAYTEIPAAMIAAVIAAVFQFTNALNSSHHIVDSAAIFRRPLARKMASYALLLNQSILTIPKFTLECGSVIKEVPIAYKTWGNLNETRDNVMVICHAFTGSADVEDW